MWHLTHDMLHVTRYVLYLTHDRWGEVNLRSKLQLPSSYSLGMKVCWRLGREGWMNWWMNDKDVCRTALDISGLLIICVWCEKEETKLDKFFFFIAISLLMIDELLALKADILGHSRQLLPWPETSNFLQHATQEHCKRNHLISSLLDFFMLADLTKVPRANVKKCKSINDLFRPRHRKSFFF